MVSLSYYNETCFQRRARQNKVFVRLLVCLSAVYICLGQSLNHQEVWSIQLRRNVVPINYKLNVFKIVIETLRIEKSISSLT